MKALALLVVLLSAVCCGRRSHEVVVYTSVDQVFSEPVFQAFLSPEVARQMAASAAHMPLRAGVPTPRGVQRVSDIRAMDVDYARVAEEMERIQPWLRQWAGL